MRPALRPLTLLFAIATLLLTLRLFEESWAFRRQVPCPPGWSSVSGSGARESLPGNSPAWGLRVRGDVAQKALLVHGARQPVRITFVYRSASPTSFGVQGDVTTRPIRELVFQSDQPLSTPKISDETGLYRIPLPAAPSWQTVNLTVRANSPDLPYMTLILSGPKDGAAEFTNARMSYLDAPDEELLENGDFNETWPLAAAHPVWLDWLWSLEWSPQSRWEIASAGSTGIVGLWTPRLVLLLVLAGIAFLFLSGRRAGIPLLAATGAVWVLLSAFLTVGSGLFPSVAGALFYLPDQRIAREFFSQVAWAIQMVGLVFAGWCGGRVLGRKSWIAAPLIPLFAALMMTASAGRSPSGPVVPIPDNSFLATGTGIVWLLTGAIAVGLGVLWATRQPTDTPVNPEPIRSRK